MRTPCLAFRRSPRSRLAFSFNYQIVVRPHPGCLDTLPFSFSPRLLSPVFTLLLLMNTTWLSYWHRIWPLIPWGIRKTSTYMVLRGRPQTGEVNLRGNRIVVSEWSTAMNRVGWIGLMHYSSLSKCRQREGMPVLKSMILKPNQAFEEPYTRTVYLNEGNMVARWSWWW